MEHRGLLKLFAHVRRTHAHVDASDALHVLCRLQRLSELAFGVTSECLPEILLYRNGAQRKKHVQTRIHKIKMERRVVELFHRRQLLFFQRVQSEGGITPALLENAVNLIEKKEKTVLFVERELHVPGTEGFNSDYVGAAQLQHEHCSV